MGTAVRAFKFGNLERPVVLKIVRQSKLVDDMEKKWMRREIEVHSELTKNIKGAREASVVKLYEVFDSPKYVVMVQEYCELGSILSYMR